MIDSTSHVPSNLPSDNRQPAPTHSIEPIAPITIELPPGTLGSGTIEPFLLNLDHSAGAHTANQTYSTLDNTHPSPTTSTLYTIPTLPSHETASTDSTPRTTNSPSATKTP
ncbi:hypothetical protein M501DRAFT_197465 [Patellaria atrata CBS 101060]|uniref:Uncharacterized protein n=1 Tax=Patellaria atrata CBS 101060 TaxID=1346257 RepID=A0A9P4VR83_9PEZI|nr:hypothetical protein M501DRAFT_197465 [Patellaria atrata CBS 101060]